MEVFFFIWSIVTLAVAGLAWRELTRSDRIHAHLRRRIAALRSQRRLDADRIARYEARIASLKVQLKGEYE